MSDHRPMAARSAEPLIDGFGRRVSDLRISVTDRCNFRCRYCMPAEGLPWLATDKLLSFEEITRLAELFVSLGITSIKVTGGEPLARRDVPRLIAGLRGLGAGLDISMTTNGYLLGTHAGDLAAAGLDRVTVSCDSLLRHRFQEITLRDALDKVLLGLEAAAAAELTPVKVNTVIMRNSNEDELLAFVHLARATGYEVRFIEYMPLDAQGAWSRDEVVPGRELVARINEVFALEPLQKAGSQPSRDFRFADGAPGTVGIIPSVSEPFCDSCNRVRLTADGQLRACLFSLEETDLRTPLRAGAGDVELEKAVRACVAAKWAGHRIGQDDFLAPARSMSMIGG